MLCVLVFSLCLPLCFHFPHVSWTEELCSFSLSLPWLCIFFSSLTLLQTCFLPSSRMCNASDLVLCFSASLLPSPFLFLKSAVSFPRLVRWSCVRSLNALFRFIIFRVPLFVALKKSSSFVSCPLVCLCNLYLISHLTTPLSFFFSSDLFPRCIFPFWACLLSPLSPFPRLCFVQIWNYSNLYVVAGAEEQQKRQKKEKRGRGQMEKAETQTTMKITWWIRQIEGVQ